MECVQPLKKVEDINAIKRVLVQHSQRDLLFFVLGINTGIRINDLLHLTVHEVWDGNQARECVYITDSSGKEKKAFYLNPNVRKKLEEYLFSHDLSLDDYLFKSKKNNHPITRQQAYRIINQAAKDVGVNGKIGTHTLRKTFGYHAYRKGIAISIIMRIFGHHSTSETFNYIGVDKKEEKFIKVDVNL
ncbi:tyrosine-type recombinase/integrase [Thalassobacillus pellis]|uniref:tyrosine-type recombinase/integrase n=1 Tax=Thalassobacillus pellis TaxID=748008 RepID=UPI00195F262A|nr:tyrosine-type recombinase/integrase [Thalassobacillus pellis]MBM7553984.1 integrase [Thalassobacillus pellis]